MMGRDTCRVTRLVKLPERLEAWVHAFSALEHLPADADVRNLSVGDDGARDSNRSLGVVGGFADPPLAFRISRVSGNDRARGAFEATNAVRVPAAHILVG